ncbi:zinc-dependent alcohol dehydrogenase [Cryptosporangium arvum]|uniref:Theronine dehydrogenase-like Zn-dependent dehydrogenase n=1 Tax=Cryptosporangium arvum DSM 44712 TaxID=927661 RepID=A0A010ZUE9_9ACTN|nr:alcohol dehydrogenase catalytic domain-containing protein [Cryptosporangium arvum]EXG82294.1 theronine dehydrogenase-like Zn-dependent dehydrogenase [Cryptosporangium arvum DSM 44712]
MRAVVLAEPGRVEVRDDLPEPTPGPDDVVVLVRAVGLCGSDLSVVAGHRAVPEFPWVLGHEALGEVVAIGADVVDRAIGQRVVIEPNYPCGRCEPCRNGTTAGCVRRRIVGITEPGVLAERITVPAAFAWPVPDRTGPAGGIRDDDALCAEPLAVALTAVDRLGIAPGTRCLVIGAGAQGQLVSLALRARGAVPVVTDVNTERANLAVELGAEPFLRNDERFAAVVEASGAPSALPEAISRTAHDGSIALIGQSEQTSPIRTFDLVQKRLTIHGCLIYDHPGGFAATLDLLRTHDVRPGRILRHRFSFDDAATAFRTAGAAAGKSWISLGGNES